MIKGGGGLWLRYLLHFPFLQVKIFDYYNNSEYDTRCLYQYYCKNTVKINDLISEPVGIRAQNLFMGYFYYAPQEMILYLIHRKFIYEYNHCMIENNPHMNDYKFGQMSLSYHGVQQPNCCFSL